ncbi:MULTISPECIES: cytochrome o ubiquinol oxidase subunit III [Stenotrophomonas]|jgi:cytochrome o ubiquinol oxidase subunit 3|uniref:Cytochrome bo(3) ubiquinol oxidase subunit 3 n=1 Tax=Stenotrophomonas acidaminiphila TaxID=128780 RepID=A0A0R0DZ25_9GAMM|nr:MULTISPECIES: cytochrome o ubiquinol oxidase subunit III [Stenotrophomonas]ODU47324.1 MAG: cytochrome o ubiquinol oxidase subunit III [Xanthomonadaceae bacterium SCN 69-123]OJY79993.1 MAG: cytochrome o ubiquinol oxidase subunit III [Stenotrophomonas sp. 69-14]OZB52919.1 MAG: cytochrome o ubiquinol oxidase subunit III [Stenotrophomonas sp. 14-69-23]ALJ27641.1 quinol oxidase subunit 3 [Stenotrophomonas acidaminiphila]AUZ54612.1 cytochrome o ubiquinol oxidase subunit III [Stenotrophomonas acid
MSTTAHTLNHGHAAHAADHGHDHEHHHDTGEKTIFGFWVYLMSDLLIFASLFVTYVVLAGGTNGGPGAKELFDLKFVAGETALLLISSLTFGLGMIAMHQKKVGLMFTWLVITWLLGAGFMAMEIWEFNHLVHQGYGPDHSAFLSAFFALVGTHGLHVSAGLLWLLVMFIQLKRNGLTQTNKTRMACLSLFWHFLDLVWIGVFSVVYLSGAL